MSFSQAGSFRSYIEAQNIKDKFEKAGILCWLKEEFPQAQRSPGAQGLSRVKIMVAKEQLQEALAVLSDIERQKSAHCACPQCSSKAIEPFFSSDKLSTRVRAIARLLFGDIGANKAAWYCRDCKAKFRHPVDTGQPLEDFSEDSGS